MATDNTTTERDFLDPVFKEVMTFNFGQLQRIAESMGEDLIPFLSEEVVKRIPPEKRVRGLTLSERLGGLDLEELRSLSPEAREILLRRGKREHVATGNSSAIQGLGHRHTTFSLGSGALASDEQRAFSSE